MSQSVNTQPIPELENFQWFVEHRLSGSGRTNLPLEQAVAAYRAYRSDLERLQRDIQPALDSLDRGDGRALDFEALRDRLEQKIRASETQQKCRSS
jgi:hypothetical protein